MKYYYKPEERIITSEETVRKYGTSKPINELGIYELSVQPDYIPVSFRHLADDTYYPVESYTAMQLKCIAALKAAGYTQEEAEQAIA